MWDEFDEKITKLFEFTNGKKVVIGGIRGAAGLSSIFLRGRISR